MKKISLLLSIVLILTLIFAGCGNSDDQSDDTAAPATQQTNADATPSQQESEAPATQEPLNLKANYFGPESIGPGQGMILAADKINEATDGAITIENYFSGTLVAYNDEFTATSKGIIDIAMVDAGQVAMVCSLNRVFSLPLKETPSDVFKAGDCYRQLVKDMPELQEELESMNLHWITVLSLPGYNYHGISQTVRVPEDLKGMKIDALGEGVPYFTGMGAAAISQDPGDFYMSLERGLVQGQFTIWIVTEVFKTKELCKTHTIFGDGEGGLYAPMMGFIVNLDTWNKLTPETQAAVEAGYIEGIKHQLDGDAPGIAAAKQYVEDRGDEIIHLTNAEREAWVPYMDPVVEEWAAESAANGYETAQDVYDHLMELLAAAS